MDIPHNVKESLQAYIQDGKMGAELYGFMDTPEGAAQVRQVMADLLRDSETKPGAINQQHYDMLFNQVMEIDSQAARPIVIRKIDLFKREWLRYAAIVIIMAGIGSWLYTNYLPKQSALAPQTVKVEGITDIDPGGQKAVLILADGSKISLDNASNGNVASQGVTQILKLDNGALSYTAGNQTPADADLLYNTVITPKGGQYQITLPDGSKVWLNAASSIHFPTSFPKNERPIEITGECYIQVAPDKTKPFSVKASGTVIQVLGTTFNVNAYANEPAVKTTLEMGSIKVNNEILKPGQAYWKNEVVRADLEKDLAWKNGLFNFEGVTLQEAMRQLERWYDIEVVYEKDVPKTEVMGKITKGVSLQGLLLGFKELGVNYRLDGRTLTIKP